MGKYNPKFSKVIYPIILFLLGVTFAIVDVAVGGFGYFSYALYLVYFLACILMGRAVFQGEGKQPADGGLLSKTLLAVGLGSGLVAFGAFLYMVVGPGRYKFSYTAGMCFLVLVCICVVSLGVRHIVDVVKKLK